MMWMRVDYSHAEVNLNRLLSSEKNKLILNLLATGELVKKYFEWRRKQTVRKTLPSLWYLSTYLSKNAR